MRKAAELFVLEKETCQLREILSRGNHLPKHGKTAFKQSFLTEIKRFINPAGEKSLKVRRPVKKQVFYNC